nr:MAG TPA: hypothetical protein [Caudoviricetes sp.]
MVVCDGPGSPCGGPGSLRVVGARACVVLCVTRYVVVYRCTLVA